MTSKFTAAKKYSLESGIPCRMHSCVKCCIETEMPLVKSDIERIRKLGYKLEEFATKNTGTWKLKNKHGKCVFLKTNGCAIYPYRPLGCRLYPLVYDETERRPVLDNLCPYRHQFKFSKEHVNELFKLLKTWKR